MNTNVIIELLKSKKFIVALIDFIVTIIALYFGIDPMAILAITIPFLSAILGIILQDFGKEGQKAKLEIEKVKLQQLDVKHKTRSLELKSEWDRHISNRDSNFDNHPA